MATHRFKPLLSLCLIPLLLATAGCQTLNPTREQQLSSLEEKEKTATQTAQGNAVSLAGKLATLILPFFSQ